MSKKKKKKARAMEPGLYKINGKIPPREPLFIDGKYVRRNWTDFDAWPANLLVYINKKTEQISEHIEPFEYYYLTKNGSDIILVKNYEIDRWNYITKHLVKFIDNDNEKTIIQNLLAAGKITEKDIEEAKKI